MKLKDLIEALKNEYVVGMVDDHDKGKNWGISIALGLVYQLDGYPVEKEKLYRVELIKGKYLIYNHKNKQLHNQELDMYVGEHEQREFTEQEIKNIDERY